MNPEVRGGEVERYGVVAGCNARGIEPVAVKEREDLATRVAAVSSGADITGLAGPLCRLMPDVVWRPWITPTRHRSCSIPRSPEGKGHPQRSMVFANRCDPERRIRG